MFLFRKTTGLKLKENEGSSFSSLRNASYLHQLTALADNIRRLMRKSDESSQYTKFLQPLYLVRDTATILGIIAASK